MRYFIKNELDIKRDVNSNTNLMKIGDKTHIILNPNESYCDLKIELTSLDIISLDGIYTYDTYKYLHVFIRPFLRDLISLVAINPTQNDIDLLYLMLKHKIMIQNKEDNGNSDYSYEEFMYRFITKQLIDFNIHIDKLISNCLYEKFHKLIVQVYKTSFENFLDIINDFKTYYDNLETTIDIENYMIEYNNFIDFIISTINGLFDKHKDNFIVKNELIDLFYKINKIDTNVFNDLVNDILYNYNNWIDLIKNFKPKDIRWDKYTNGDYVLLKFEYKCDLLYKHQSSSHPMIISIDNENKLKNKFKNMILQLFIINNKSKFEKDMITHFISRDDTYIYI